MAPARERVFAKPWNSGDLTDCLDLLLLLLIDDAVSVCWSNDEADEFESILQSFRLGLAQHWSSTMLDDRPALPAVAAANTTAARVRRPEKRKHKNQIN